MWDRKELKSRGRAAFKANYWRCVLAALLLLVVIGGTVTYSANSARSQLNEQNTDISVQGNQVEINGHTYNSLQEAVTAVGESENANPEDIAALNELIDQVQNDPEMQQAMTALILVLGGIVLVVALVAGLVRIFLFSPLEVGCQSFFLRNAEAPAELGELKRGFHPYWRSVGTMFLTKLFLFLWTLLLIVPGIVKSYSYRMVPYILADQPDVSGRDAISLSRQMMDGHKWNAFLLDLSFIGWILLSCLTLGLVGVFYVNPYMFCTDAELYRELKNKK